ncbi:MAG: hypothetical protein H6712_17340 [Myxococcales bacterium]|nr:hypothetical protein [Myxococcales bacterium]MCB9715637.1 hypothetical protein [Myxococcales bacterium]
MRDPLALITTFFIVACDPGGSGGSGTDDDGTPSTTDPDTSSTGTPGDTSGTGGGDDDTDPGTTSEGSGGEDTGILCEDLDQLDPRRVLIETRPAVLEAIDLAEVLAAISTNAGLDPDPLATHDALFDTYRVAAMGELDGAHCDDEQVDGVPSLNGFPLLCPRSEGAFAAFDGALDGWLAIAMVNRIDMAPVDGSHCGEQRIVFANPSMVGRAFIIIEAQIPNPAPGCGVAACGPVASLWAELDAVDDPLERRSRLRAAFIDGDPDLQAAGFGPFMSADNLTFGTGQIRTNNFVTGPWTLRQYELVPHAVGSQTVARPVPVPVSASPHDTLWNDLMASPVGSQCRQAMLDALPGLLGDDPATLGWSIPEACRSSESVEFQDFYEEHLASGSGSFVAAIETELDALAPGSGLDAFDVARRAQFAGSCIGCHEHSADVSLGGGLVAPPSLGFVHVTEELTEPCGGGGDCFAISPALSDVFLPRRMEALQQALSEACTDGCAASAPAPRPGFALPPVGTSVAELHARERAATGGGMTLGGRPVGAGH